MSEADGSLHVMLRQDLPIPLDVAFSCAPGQILALVGPSGSGKSTILRSIAGIYTPKQGKIRCANQDWLDTERGIRVDTRQRSVGVVFQSYALFPHLSALHNVMEALIAWPVSERLLRAQALLARTHLEGLEHRRPNELSGGQQQRVAVARALARDPQALLLDEPFSAVDQVTRDKLYEDLVAERAGLRMPVVLVTHALDEAAILADRMCVLYGGRVLQIGTPYEVMTRPQRPLVARVLGLRNMFEGQVLRHEEAQGVTHIRWGAATLQAKLNHAFAEGEKVCWFVPQTHIVLHRQDQAQRPVQESPLQGIVARSVALREMSLIQLSVAAVPGAVLSFSIPTRIAQRNALEPGTRITVSILAEGIHLMPAEANAE